MLSINEKELDVSLWLRNIHLFINFKTTIQVSYKVENITHLSY